MKQKNDFVKKIQTLNKELNERDLKNENDNMVLVWNASFDYQVLNSFVSFCPIRLAPFC